MGGWGGRLTSFGMTPPAKESDVELAKHLAAVAAPVAMKWFKSTALGVQHKADGSPVTQADIEIENLLRALVRENDPDAAILGEEGGATGASDRKWFFDPIDGTEPFVHGVPLWSTLIALHDEHGPAVGVISLPGVDELVVGARGRGCTLNGETCFVSSRDSLQDALVTTWGYECWPASFIETLQTRGARLRGWGDAYGWALVATGRADVVIDVGLNPWDIAPMQVIIPEAGGRFSAFDGTDTLATSKAFATNTSLYDEMVQQLHGVEFDK